LFQAAGNRQIDDVVKHEVAFIQRVGRAREFNRAAPVLTRSFAILSDSVDVGGSITLLVPILELP